MTPHQKATDDPTFVSVESIAMLGKKQLFTTILVGHFINGPKFCGEIEPCQTTFLPEGAGAPDLYGRAESVLCHPTL